MGAAELAKKLWSPCPVGGAELQIDGDLLNETLRGHNPHEVLLRTERIAGRNQPKLALVHFHELSNDLCHPDAVLHSTTTKIPTFDTEVAKLQIDAEVDTLLGKTLELFDKGPQAPAYLCLTEEPVVYNSERVHIYI